MRERTPAGEAATEVIVSIFRANGLLLSRGDVITASEELTSARWQVMGAIALAERPLTVPQVARRMGITRQSVHATVKRLVTDGLVELATNVDHRRSQLVRLTDLGRRRYAVLDRRQAEWVNGLVHGITRAELATTARVLTGLSARLEGEAGRAWSTA